MANQEKEIKADAGGDTIASILTELTALKAKVRRMSNNWKRFVKTHVDESSNGTIVSLLLICLLVLPVFASESVDNKSAGTGTYRLDQEGNGTGDITLTVNKIVIDSQTTGAVASAVSATATTAETMFLPYKTVITCNDVPITNIIYGGSGTNSSGYVKLYDFDEGVTDIELVTVANVIITPSDASTNTGFAAADGCDWALGTVAAAGGTISSTEVDLCPSTSQDPMNSTNSSLLGAGVTFDGTSTAKDMYFNLLVDADDITNGIGLCTFDATITIYRNPPVIY